MAKGQFDFGERVRRRTVDFRCKVGAAYRDRRIVGGVGVIMAAVATEECKADALFPDPTLLPQPVTHGLQRHGWTVRAHEIELLQASQAMFG